MMMTSKRQLIFPPSQRSEDLAERAIKQITDFGNSITNDETQKQYLLQVVESHRSKITDFRFT